MRRGFAPIVIIPIIAAFVLGIGTTAAYIKLQQKPASPPQPNLNAPSAVQNPQLSVSPDPTTEWKSYNNSSHSFTIKYPPDMTLEELKDHVTIFRGEKREQSPFDVRDPFPVPNITFAKGGKGRTAREVCESLDLNSKCKTNTVNSVTKTYTESSINNIDAIKLVWNTDPYSPSYYMARNDRSGGFVVGLSTDNRDGPENLRSVVDKQKDLDELDQILSTFRFLD